MARPFPSKGERQGGPGPRPAGAPRPGPASRPRPVVPPRSLRCHRRRGRRRGPSPQWERGREGRKGPGPANETPPGARLRGRRERRGQERPVHPSARLPLVPAASLVADDAVDVLPLDGGGQGRRRSPGPGPRSHRRRRTRPPAVASRPEGARRPPPAALPRLRRHPCRRRRRRGPPRRKRGGRGVGDAWRATTHHQKGRALASARAPQPTADRRARRGTAPPPAPVVVATTVAAAQDAREDDTIVPGHASCPALNPLA